MVRLNQMHTIKEKICPIIKQPDMCGIHLGEKVLLLPGILQDNLYFLPSPTEKYHSKCFVMRGYTMHLQNTTRPLFKKKVLIPFLQVLPGQLHKE